jgi:hypothetical protein
MLSFGQQPYEQIKKNSAVIEFVNSGGRLTKPNVSNDDM